MAIDKALNRAPMGLAPSDDNEEGSDIEIVLETEDNEPEDKEEETRDDEFNENLADGVLEESSLVELCSEILSDYEDDVNSRKDWIQTYVDGLDLLGLKMEEKTEPWVGACGVHHPILAEAVVKFQAETMMETFPAAGPVRVQIIGEETKEKKEAALRVESDMNNQLTNVMTEYRPEHEKMLWGLGLSGNAFKKVYYDPSLKRQAPNTYLRKM